MGEGLCGWVSVTANLQLSTRSCSWRFSPRCLRLGRCGTLRATAASSVLLSGRPRTQWHLRKPQRGSWTLCCSERLGQASVEAAACLPVAMLLLAMLLQPAFLLYTRAVMQQAAAEGTRVLATREEDGIADDEACRAYVLRRLAAVPNVPAFHVGAADGWEVAVAGGAATNDVSVEVVGRIRPLPLVGVMAGMLGEVDGDEVVLRVQVTSSTRPAWLKGGYRDWISMWE